MINYIITIALSLVMGLSVFLSWPIVSRKNISLRRMLFYNAFAAGILVFLLMDIYGDVASIFNNSNITNPMELLFIAAFAISFLFLVYPRSSRDPEENPKRTSVLSAIGIGFQNLTEGLVFGSAGAAGMVPLYIVSVVGFSLQNTTEGFPIAMPLVAMKQKIEKRFIAGAFLLGGIPAVIGTLIGLVFFSNTFIIFFDALAAAAILYVTLVLFHVNINKSRAKDRREMSSLMWLTYSGILAGFVVAFVINYIVVVQ